MERCNLIDHHIKMFQKWKKLKEKIPIWFPINSCPKVHVLTTFKIFDEYLAGCVCWLRFVVDAFGTNILYVQRYEDNLAFRKSIIVHHTSLTPICYYWYTNFNTSETEIIACCTHNHFITSEAQFYPNNLNSKIYYQQKNKIWKVFRSNFGVIIKYHQT